MDQTIPREPSRLMRALAEMSTEMSTSAEHDLLYLFGFGETLAFIEAANEREPNAYDLTVSSIQRVAWAWRDYDSDDWAGGFVFDLADGRRVYVESQADGTCWGPESRVRLLPMPANDDLPDLGHAHPSRLYGWASDLQELGAYLERLR